jgi:hypothetical protein
MATCYDCIHMGRRTHGKLEVSCDHPDRYKLPTVTIDTPACDKAFLSHKARQVIALEKLAQQGEG